MRIRRATVAADALPTSAEIEAAVRRSIMHRLIAVASLFIFGGFCLSGAGYAATKTATVAAYLALGEFNSRGLQLKSYFQQIRNYSSHDVALYALGMGAVDVAVAEYRVAEKWLAANKGRVILETKAVPSIGIALNASLDKAVKLNIRDALVSPNPKRLPVAQRASVRIVVITAGTRGDY